MYSFQEIVKDIFVLKTPFSTVWTGITLIRGEKNFLIDSGAHAPEMYLIPALAELGMKITDVDYLLNTHCHGDHITGHSDLVTKYGIRTATYKGGVAALTDPAAKSRDRIVKKSEKDGLYTALDFGCVWLERALAGK